jgi:hypothetical protein
MTPPLFDALKACVEAEEKDGPGANYTLVPIPSGIQELVDLGFSRASLGVSLSKLWVMDAGRRAIAA